MKFYFSIGRRTLIGIFIFLILMFLLWGIFYSASNNLPNGSTNALRMEFAQSIGCVTREELLYEKSFTLPVEFDNELNQYNAIQRKAGYDLSAFCGEKVKLYSYRVVSYGALDIEDNAILNLIVYNGRIIGGDISGDSGKNISFPLIKVN